MLACVAGALGGGFETGKVWNGGIPQFQTFPVPNPPPKAPATQFILMWDWVLPYTRQNLCPVTFSCMLLYDYNVLSRYIFLTHNT